MGRIRLQLPAELRPFQLGFEGVTDRSCNGSVHFHPLATVELTDEEAEAFKRERPDLVGRIVVIGVESEPEGKPEAEPELKAGTEVKMGTNPEPEAVGVKVKETSQPPPEMKHVPEPPKKAMNAFRRKHRGT